MKNLGIIVLFLFVGTSVNSQHIIGLPKEDIIKKMQETSFVIDNTSKNTSFNYLKYVDRFEEKTLLVFLSKEEICTATKLMCDYSSYKETISVFNKNYRKVSSNIWNYVIEGVTYKVTLKKEEWFFSVVVTPKNN